MNRVNVRRLTPEQWALLAADAHLVVFNETWHEDMERIDFALVVVDESDLPIMYATIRELDRDTSYIQYGGAFPSYKGTVRSLESFRAILDHLRGSYKRTGFMTENKNKTMLKMGIKTDFEIIGIRYFNGQLLLEHELEFHKESVK